MDGWHIDVGLTVIDPPAGHEDETVRDEGPRAARATALELTVVRNPRSNHAGADEPRPATESEGG